MNKLLQTVFTFLAFSFLIASSCHKNDSGPAPTKAQHLTRFPWKFEKATAAGIDVSSQIPDCFKDNTITFNASGNGTVDEGAIGCVPPTATSFVWSFKNNETQLDLSASIIPGGSGLFDIVTLGELTMELSQDMIIPPATSAVKVVIRFKH